MWLAAASLASASACASVSPHIQQPLTEHQLQLALDRAQAPLAPSTEQPGRETREPRPNYALPAIEIVAMDALINAFGRRGPEADAYKVNGTSIRSNVEGPWIIDNDPFAVNQLMHP
jgi:hypothetical protein